MDYGNAFSQKLYTLTHSHSTSHIVSICFLFKMKKSAKEGFPNVTRNLRHYVINLPFLFLFHLYVIVKHYTFLYVSLILKIGSTIVMNQLHQLIWLNTVFP